MSENILSVRDLSVHYVKEKNVVKAVNHLTFDLVAGETLGLVGETGAGKTTTALAIMNLVPNPPGRIAGGEIIFQGENVLKKSRHELRKMRGREVSMIFQDPMACLNPRKKVLDIVAQGLDLHGMCHSSKEREEKVYSILKMVGLSKEHATRYPHQFSGGQRQRIGIARALIMDPDLIIADEAISALDVSIQAQVVNLMKEIQAQTGSAILFIAHDLSMVKYISDRIGVLHLGHLVETGTTEEIFENPIHPYTRSLLSAIPQPDPIGEKKRGALSYDYGEMGIDYKAGTSHFIQGQHYVLGTEDEIKSWSKKA